VMAAAAKAAPRAGLDYARRPMLVFWETTRACGLACRHCRASATAQSLPGELTTSEGRVRVPYARLRGSANVAASGVVAGFQVTDGGAGDVGAD
jgi:MoaA/NifB/PqqE/SkfB family radical SAM enzyme